LAIIRRASQVAFEQEKQTNAKRPTRKKLANTTRLGEPTGALLVTPYEKGSRLAPVLLQLRAGNLQTVHIGQMFGIPKNNA
jgi:hypothetical protein